MIKNKEKVVLMVENNLDHIELALDAFSQSNLKLSVKVLRTGNEAVDYLQRRDGIDDSGDNVRPDAIFFDVKTMGWQGFTWLERIQANNGEERIPIVMLSSSENSYDKQLSSKLGAADLMFKPLNPRRIKTQLRKLGLI
ncbi:MAG: response regulator [Spirochaetales bacterium]|nr:response regulator [Spirochaetales bacterium]